MGKEVRVFKDKGTTGVDTVKEIWRDGGWKVVGTGNREGSGGLGHGVLS